MALSPPISCSVCGDGVDPEASYWCGLCSDFNRTVFADGLTFTPDAPRSVFSDAVDQTSLPLDREVAVRRSIFEDITDGRREQSQTDWSRSNSIASKTWVEETVPDILKTSPRSLAGLERAETIGRYSIYDFEVKRKFEPTPEPWVHLVTCDALEAAQILHTKARDQGKDPSIFVLGYRDCLPPKDTEIPFGYPEEIDSLCESTKLAWSLHEANKKRLQFSHSKTEELSWEEVTLAPDVLVARMHSNAELLPESEHFHVNVVSMCGDPVIRSDSTDVSLEQQYRMQCQLDHVLNLCLSRGADYIILRPMEYCKFWDGGARIQASIMRTFLSKLFKEHWSSDEDETWQNRGLNHVIITVSETYGNTNGRGPWSDYVEQLETWSAVHVVKDAQELPDLPRRRPAGEHLTVYQPILYIPRYPLENGFQDEEYAAAAKQRYFSMVKNNTSSIRSTVILPKISVSNADAALAYVDGGSEMHRRIGRIMQEIITRLDIPHMNQSFIPLRRLYLRYALLQIYEYVSDRVAGGLMQAAEATLFLEDLRQI